MTAILLCLLFVGRILLEKKKGIMEPIWIVSMFSLEQDYLKETNRFLYVFSATITFFWFFIMQYLTNMMSTELVVVKDPKAILSYQDIIESENSRPIFPKSWLDHEEFELALEGTIERTVWKTGMSRVNEDRDKLFDALDYDVMGKWYRIIAQESVYIQRYSTIKFVLLYFLRLRDEAMKTDEARIYEDLRFILTSDPAARRFPQSFVFSPFIDEKIYSRIFRKTRMYTEGGLPDKVLASVLADYLPQTQSMLEAFSSKIQVIPPPQPDLSISNMILTLKVMADAIIFSAFVVIIELLYFRWQQKKNPAPLDRIFIVRKKRPQIITRK